MSDEVAKWQRMFSSAAERAKSAEAERDAAMTEVSRLADALNREDALPCCDAAIERDRAVAQVGELSLRIATARYWVDRHRGEWGGLTIELDNIQDGLNGTPGGVRDEVARDLARAALAAEDH